LGGFEVKQRDCKVIFLIVVVFSIACIGMAFADTGVPAVPEIQGLTTGTSAVVVGTVTETDSGAWTLTKDPFVLDIFTYSPGVSEPSQFTVLIPAIMAQLQGAGGSASYYIGGNGHIYITAASVPTTLLNQPIAGLGGITYQQAIDNALQRYPQIQSSVSKPGIHSGVLDPGQVQYTIGYNDQYFGISGQQTFVKSMAISTANTIADQSNIKAKTDIQFIAVDTGRATRSEDLLLDGASQATNGANAILCPFVAPNPSIIPAFCNIVQAGSAFDTTLTSTVTSADTRFVGTDASIPVVLNYNINAKGITIGNQTSPMIGSVSAYLKVHIQEARNESVNAGSVLGSPYSFPDSLNPKKSEDLVYSEASSASGLISGFTKSMSYSSQASAVQAPIPVIPVLNRP
jgi:hypothetical protein